MGQWFLWFCLHFYFAYKNPFESLNMGLQSDITCCPNDYSVVQCVQILHMWSIVEAQEESVSEGEDMDVDPSASQDYPECTQSQSSETLKR